jgi:hypothetical protein
MPVEQFNSRLDLEGHLQGALIESVEAINQEAEQGGISPLFDDEDAMFAAVCSYYVTAVRLARSGWWVSDEVPLWWTEVVTDDADKHHDAIQWLTRRKLRDAVVAAFYSQSASDVLQARLVLMSEDKELSAKLRMLFDH